MPGAARPLRAEHYELNSPSSTENVGDQRDHRKDQQEMNQPAGHMKGDPGQNPDNQEDEEY
jgi:hypothetical protein